MQVLRAARGLGSDLVPHGFCQDLLAKAGQPGFKGQGREPWGKLLLGELQGHVAKGVETVKEGELGPFCSLSTIPTWAS